jgi:hypothetical protein
MWLGDMGLPGVENAHYPGNNHLDGRNGRCARAGGLGIREIQNLNAKAQRAAKKRSV